MTMRVGGAGAHGAGPVRDRALGRLFGRGGAEIVAGPEGAGDGAGVRVLVEHTDGAVRHAVEAILVREGCEVVGCGGPRSFRRSRCPLLTTGSCPLADGADVVVHALNPDHRVNAGVLGALKGRYPETPIVVEVPDPALDRHAELLAGCHTIRAPMTRDRLVAAVTAAIADPGPLGIDGSG